MMGIISQSKRWFPQKGFECSQGEWFFATGEWCFKKSNFFLKKLFEKNCVKMKGLCMVLFPFNDKKKGKAEAKESAKIF